MKNTFRGVKKILGCVGCLFCAGAFGVLTFFLLFWIGMTSKLDLELAAADVTRGLGVPHSEIHCLSKNTQRVFPWVVYEYVGSNRVELLNKCRSLHYTDDPKICRFLRQPHLDAAEREKCIEGFLVKYNLDLQRIVYALAHYEIALDDSISCIYALKDEESLQGAYVRVAEIGSRLLVFWKQPTGM